jgi:hypothetical protein
MKKVSKTTPRTSTPENVATDMPPQLAVVGLPVIHIFGGTFTLDQITTTAVGMGNFNWFVRVKITPTSGSSLVIGGAGPKIHLKKADGTFTAEADMDRDDTAPLTGPTYWKKSGTVPGKPLEYFCTAQFIDTNRTPITGTFP